MIVRGIITVGAVGTGIRVTSVAGILGWWWSTFGVNGTVTGITWWTVWAVTV